MDPLSAANTFATIVSLLSIFKSERTASAADECKDFTEWLEEKRYDSLVEEIRSNHLLSDGIKNLLSQNHEHVVLALRSLQETMAKLASRVSEFHQIAVAISPTISLSDQALSVLQQLDESGGSTFLQLKTFDGTNYIITDGDCGFIEISEPRFVDDDLTVLEELGLLRPAINSQGDKLWRITREASKLVSQSDKRML